jgi:integrase
MLATAVEDGLLRANPSAGVRIGSPVINDHEDEEQVKALTPEQLADLVEEVPEGWRRLLVTTLAQTGLRISEALGLRWADVDGKRGRLVIRRRVRDGDVGATKSRLGRREVPIAPALARELAAHRLSSPWSADGDYVFSAEAGGPIMARNLYRWFTPAAKRAGVGWAAFHALRHTAASRWLLAGVSIAQVSRLLGHADPGFTLRVYISVLPDDLPDCEALASALGMA